MKKTGMLVVLSIFLNLFTGCVVPASAPAPFASPTSPVPPFGAVEIVPVIPTALPNTATPVPPTVTPQPTPTLVFHSQIIWDKGYDKQFNDMGEDMVAAADGGFYVVGTANLDMNGAGLSGDVYLARINADGEVLWEKTYGGDKAEEGLSLAQLSDGNLLLAGKTHSSGAGGADVYLVKVDAEGNELWNKTFGSSLDETASVRVLADGSLMLYGNVVDPNDLIADPGAAGYSGYAGRSNAYLAKVDAAGNQLWAQTFGGQSNLLVSAGVATPDGGFIVAATLLRYPDPGDDIYLFKVDGDGKLIWERTWEDETLAAYDLIGTADNNYLLAGSFIPLEGGAQAKADFLFIKVDEQGNEIWRNTFGDPDMMDYPQVVAETSAGGYLALGDWVKDWSGRNPASISIVTIDAAGQPLWQEVIKITSRHTILRTLLRNSDGSYDVVGSRMKGQQFDVLLMKVDVGESGAAYPSQPDASQSD